MTASPEARLERIVAKAQGKGGLDGIVVRVERRDGGFAWTGAAGDLGPSSPFFIASVTKLYTTAIVLRLVQAGRLSLDDRLVDRVERARVDRLHVQRGTDRTDRITVRHLLSQTSGLPDYFQGKQPDGTSLEQTLRSGQDRAWTPDEALALTRTMEARFPPGAPGRAHYSDANFQLLGLIIEGVDGVPYGEALERHVIAPLGLADTWLYADPEDRRPRPLHDRGRILDITLAMTSFGPDGGIVSTAEALMRFLRAFFEGGLFDRSFLGPPMTYNRIFFPLQYGLGFVRFKLPRIMSPLADPPEMLGHSGLSGAFAFWVPSRAVYLAGTVNDLARPDRSFRLMLELCRAL